jgi:NAD(P)H-nitrite reductase large subunit
MQTNINNIYAAGDIVEVWDQIQMKNDIYATWPNAIEQGRIAGLNMVGLTTNYDGAEVVNVLDIFDTPVVAVGQTSDVMKRIKTISSFTPKTSKKIILKDDKIIGLQFVGSIRNTGTFYSIMKKGLSVSGLEDRLMDENFIISPHVE